MRPARLHLATLRCSTLRAVLENRIPGLPIVIPSLPSHTRKKMEQVLVMADVLETMVCLHLEARVKGYSETTRQELQMISDTLGSLKIPLIHEFLAERFPDVKEKTDQAEPDAAVPAPDKLPQPRVRKPPGKRKGRKPDAVGEPKGS